LQPASEEVLVSMRPEPVLRRGLVIAAVLAAAVATLTVD
jgi:hypothetical protein